MSKEFRITLGSQHVALLEPLRFELKAENEVVSEVLADVGYVHRGIERAVTSKFAFRQAPYVVARVCGLCAITHSTVYCQAIEELLGCELTERASWLRILGLELDRVHSHLLCLSHTAENAGYEALFMRLMGDREVVMESHELLSGNRIQVDYSLIGGVSRDMTPEVDAGLRQRLDEIETHLDGYEETFTHNRTMMSKHKGVSALTPQQVKHLNAVGPMARAAGVRVDVRAEKTNPLPYDKVGYQMRLSEGGDVYARNQVRLAEIRDSIQMCRNVLDGLPEGDFKTKARGKPDGETMALIEAPRGELAYVVRGDGSNVLKRVKIKTPTFSNIPAMVEALRGEQYSDVPTVLASYDPCLSCTAR